MREGTPDPNPIRLAVVATHPVQYYAPVFALLAARPELEVRVFYGHDPEASNSFDAGFGREVTWDLDLRTGYDHEFVPNLAKQPHQSGFWGIHAPDLPSRILAWGAEAVLVIGWSVRSHLNVMRTLHGRVPIYFRGDSTLLDPLPLHRRLLRKGLLSWIYRHVDVAFAVGTRSREYFRFAGLRDEQIEFAPHSIDNERFATDSSQRCVEATQWRSRLGISEDRVVFLFTGKLERKKGPDLLLDAYRSLGDEPGAALAFVGSGELESELRAGATADTYFLGFQNQQAMPTAYRVGDLMCLPSRGPGETWGLAVNEAMACGVPALVSDRVGCSVDLVGEGKPGWEVAADDPRAIASAMREAIALGREGLRALGNDARELIETWSFERQVAAIAGRLMRDLRSSAAMEPDS